MDDENSLLLEGYIFQLKGYCCSDGQTTVIVGVKCDGSAASCLSGWIMEIDPADPSEKKDINIISCEKRKGNGPWVPAVAENTAFELIGDIGISGVFIDERVSINPDDPETEFRIVLSGEIDCTCVKFGYVSGEDVFCTDETLQPSPPESLRLTPIEKSFCLYIVVTDGYKPAADEINVSITKRGLFLAHEKGGFKAESEQFPAVRTIKADVLGTVKIAASVTLENFLACGDTAHASACDCFEVCETIGYSNEDDTFDIEDVYVYPLKESYDLTLLNSRCGKAVYRLDGDYIIDFKDNGI